MISFETVVRMIAGIGAAELRTWIDEGWVRPENEPGGYIFREIDVARVRLIQDLRQHLAIDREAVPVVLNLLDQVYAMRRRLRRLDEAIAAQPVAVRRRLKVAMKGKATPARRGRK